MYFSGVKFLRDTNPVKRFADSTYFRAIIHRQEDDLIPDSIGEPPQGIKNILNLQKKERVKEPKKPYYIPGHTPADFLNAPAIDRTDPVITLPETEGAGEGAGEEAEIDFTGIHRNPEFIAHLQSPGYDNATTAGSISDPAVAQHVNVAYHVAVPGLELVKSRGGRGGEGGAGYKLRLDGAGLYLATPERLAETQTTLRELHTVATGRTAKRIERDIKTITKAIEEQGGTAPAPMVGGGGGAPAPESESEPESSSDEDAPAPAPAPAYTGVKYTLHGGAGEHDMTAWNKEKTEELAGSLGIPNVGYKKLVDLKKSIVEHTKGGTA